MDIYLSLMVLTFIVGYFFITIEHKTGVSKTAVALAMAIICWVIQFFRASHDNNMHDLLEHLANISQIVFFLLGALAIVETIHAHRGFNLISNAITIRGKRPLLWIICLTTFFLSAILDNLTTTIVMVTLIRKLIEKGEERLLVGGAIVIAANAGGAWTPIGDVTTTMLWIDGKLSTWPIMRDLFLPSLVCLLVAVVYFHFGLKGNFHPADDRKEHKELEPMGKLIFWLGIGSLISVPIFKVLTGLPPFMGMLLGLSIIWIVTDIIHYRHSEQQHLRLPLTISKIDFSSILFFLGILLCIDALDTAQILTSVARWMDYHLGNPHAIAVALGLLSAVIDNVPLVAAIMKMYDVSQFPMDSSFWQLVAYCAGTGGSILVIGSAAGVAFMGMEKVEFFWYFRRIGIPALLGYFAGIAVYLLFL